MSLSQQSGETNDFESNGPILRIDVSDLPRLEGLPEDPIWLFVGGDQFCVFIDASVFLRVAEIGSSFFLDLYPREDDNDQFEITLGTYEIRGDRLRTLCKPIERLVSEVVRSGEVASVLKVRASTSTGQLPLTLSPETLRLLADAEISLMVQTPSEQD